MRMVIYEQARNRREDVQNLSTRDCAGFWGTYGKFACFCSMLQSGTLDAPPTRLAHLTISEYLAPGFQNLYPVDKAIQSWFTVCLTFIRCQWILIYPVDSSTQVLNNLSGQVYKFLPVILRSGR